MDKVRTHTKKRFSIVPVGIVVVVVVLVLSQISEAYFAAKPNGQLWRETVVTQDLQLQVKGFGSLQSKQQRFLTAPYSAVVEQIFIKPGSFVTKDSVIARLSNPV
ncbi:hypothetical protein CWB96_08040 [Pseudoalteromonas citrea]|uniref:Membrane fusion protein biotin-lipoyl like domain-containing protein n=1 Tax=Pseudoalteromonas citrea TaxID=43655 RepID=A0A5S3XTH1_9GAMM|nr:hypothetical protein [Pseudoalteromonas citrea]TMP37827.1 hypothetical protein CWB97_22560 [Pseudoalteromonas citrea]TMP59971.1 hypothetical protein CWB96_08040 [Pseudoalteromonas citrea]